MTEWNRRTALAGMTGLAVWPARAEDKKKASPLAHGVLANNAAAQEFEAVDAELPDLYLWGLKTKYTFDQLKGRTILMPLWAEWCGPCWTELPDFARLQAKYGNDKFAIMPVLTGTQKKLSPETLGPILKLAHADIFEPLIEEGRGEKLMRRMARQANGEAAIPCNLLIAPDGRVVGREIGRIGNGDDADPAKGYTAMLKRTEQGAVQSIWGQPAGEEFAKAMAAGFLA